MFPSRSCSQPGILSLGQSGLLSTLGSPHASDFSSVHANWAAFIFFSTFLICHLFLPLCGLIISWQNSSFHLVTHSTDTCHHLQQWMGLNAMLLLKPWDTDILKLLTKTLQKWKKMKHLSWEASKTIVGASRLDNAIAGPNQY